MLHRGEIQQLANFLLAGMTPSSQIKESPENPGRFSPGILLKAHPNDGWNYAILYSQCAPG
jgi:hypothetical protein